MIMPPTGGSFGGKQDPWPFIATALMTQAVRRPVRLIYSRTESFDATPKRHPYVVRSKIGATADGRLTGIRIRIDANTGGYDAGGQYIPNYAVTASGGPYHWQAVDAYAQTVYTNGPKAGQYRGFGTAQSAFAAECALDELAEKLGIDPLELRLKNTLRTGGISFLGYPVAETIGFTQVLKALRPHYVAYLAMPMRSTDLLVYLFPCLPVYQPPIHQFLNLPLAAASASPASGTASANPARCGSRRTLSWHGTAASSSIAPRLTTARG